MGLVISRRRASLIILLVVVIVNGAALGFAFAPTHATPTASPLDRKATVGGLQISYPANWSIRRVPAWFPGQAADALALAPASSGTGVLIVGSTVAANPQLLPNDLVGNRAAAPAAETVNLGGKQFYRYRKIPLRGTTSLGSVYALSTTAGVVLGVCVPEGRGSAVLSSCERSLTTLRLTSSQALPPGPVAQYAARFNLAIKSLDSVRARVGPQLANATTASAQAQASDTLATAHLRAASALAALSPGPATAANNQVVAALKQVGILYQQLGRAASERRTASYEQTRAEMTKASGTLNAALGQLQRFGYSSLT